MENSNLKIAFFGSSIVSAYWNGAATYYRGIVKALHKMGHRVTFYEPDIYERQKHRDIDDPYWCKVIIYEDDKVTLRGLLRKAQEEADVIIKTSGVGVFDEFLEEEIAHMKRDDNLIIFWDVDAPATLDRLETHANDPFHKLIPLYDLILTYGGGRPVIDAYFKNGAQKCIPIYNALDIDTHFPVSPQAHYKGALSFLGNRLPDREKRVETFFIRPAANLPDYKFILGGSGWADKELPDNISYVGHVYTKDHNAFNCSPLAILNISRDSMAKYGFSPATRVFEAAGAGACIITDYWKGIETFFTPEKEILIAKDGKDIEEIIENLTPEKAKEIGQAAFKKVIGIHTYAHRAQLLEEVIQLNLQPSKPKI